MREFLMPALGADMEDGTLIEYERRPGERVQRGDVVAVVETQKGAIEIESFEEGVLDAWLVDIGKTVPVGTPLAMIRSLKEQHATVGQMKDLTERSDERPTQSDMGIQAGTESTLPDTNVTITPAELPDANTTVTPVRPPDKPAAQSRVRITPAARRLAAELGIHADTLKPSGPHGEIRLADVQSATDAAQSARNQVSGSVKASDELPDRRTAMRRAIASAMAHSKREIPHYYLFQRVDLTAAERYLRTYNEDRPPDERLLLGALYVRAVAMSARRYPELNGHFIDEEFVCADNVHVGMAIRLRGGGLVAPALHKVDNASVQDVMSRLRDLVERVRLGRFRATELTDATITLSSLGERGVDGLLGVIIPPQVAILGAGTPTLQARALASGVEPRRMVDLSLSGDHRVSDGHRGAAFLRAIDEALQEPEKL